MLYAIKQFIALSNIDHKVVENSLAEDEHLNLNSIVFSCAPPLPARLAIIENHRADDRTVGVGTRSSQQV